MIYFVMLIFAGVLGTICVGCVPTLTRRWCRGIFLRSLFVFALVSGPGIYVAKG